MPDDNGGNGGEEQLEVGTVEDGLDPEAEAVAEKIEDAFNE